MRQWHHCCLTTSFFAYSLTRRPIWKLSQPPYSKEMVIVAAKASLEKLQVQKVGVFYIHPPDFKTPLEDTLVGVNKAYKTGTPQRFSLSNYPSEKVQKEYNTYKQIDSRVGDFQPLIRLKVRPTWPSNAFRLHSQRV